MIKLPAIIKKVSTLSDKTIRITVDTNEPTPDQMSEVFTLLDSFGWFVFAENVKLEDIPTENVPEFTEDKSPSKRLRDCLFVYWKNNTNQQTPFDTFWKNWVDKKCNEIKELLP